MILVDTSIWIDFFRGASLPQSSLFNQDDVLREIVVGDIILLEVLQGARDDRDARIIEATMREFEVVGLLGEALAIRAARNFRSLRSLGVTIRRTTDLIIGTWCITNNARLLHNDRDFDHMERHLGLMVA